MSKDTEKEQGIPSEMANFVDAVDPLSGPNVMRRADQLSTDNGDGTMTLRRLDPNKLESRKSSSSIKTDHS